MMYTPHYQRWQTARRLSVLAGLAVSVILGAGESAACILNLTIANPPCTSTGSNASTCPGGEEVSFTTSLSAACSIEKTIWRIINLDSGETTDSTYTTWQPGFTQTFSEAGTYSVKPIVFPTSHPQSTKPITVTVTETPFTVNIIPTAGCTVMGRDGGVDDAEPDSNGIVCSGGMTEDDPLCAEQFQNTHIASLKVVPDEGYDFAYWEMNGAILQQAGAETLFLSTMPVLAGVMPVPSTTKTANIRAQCLSVSLQSVTFEGMSAELIQDSGDPYPDPATEPHWKKTDDASYRPTPVVLTSGSTLAATATFAVEPADFSGELMIAGRAELEIPPWENTLLAVFGPEKATIESGTASVNIPEVMTFSEHTVDIFDVMSLSWVYTTASASSYVEAGRSNNQVYVTWAPPPCTTETPPCDQPQMYHTVVHVGSQAAKGITGTPGTDDHKVLKAIWENAFARDKTQPICRMSDGALLSYYGFFDTPKNGVRDGIWEEGWDDDRNHTDVLSAAGLLATGNGQCGSWAELLNEVMKAQGLVNINGGETHQLVLVQIMLPNRFFAINTWNTTGTDEERLIVPDLNYDAGVDGAKAVTPNPNASEASDKKGVSGQGTSPNPPPKFYLHYLVKMQGKYYDPSYGLGPYTDRKVYEDAALAGSIYKRLDNGLYYLKKLPDNNGVANNHSDEINAYSETEFP